MLSVKNSFFPDAFRGPLASAFKLHLEDVALFRDPKTGIDTDHLWYRPCLYEIILNIKCLLIKVTVLFTVRKNYSTTKKVRYFAHANLEVLVCFNGKYF